MINYSLARPNETELIEHLEQCSVNWKETALSILGYLSDDEVKDWAESEGYDIFDNEWEEE